MLLLKKIFTSSVGRKSLMAITGLALIGFLLGHLAGNLLIFKGQDAMNSYAENLQSLGALLWVVRGGLLTIFAIHVGLGLLLTLENKRARPVAYQYSSTIQASLASRSMYITGILILAFIIMHLAHFTLGLVQPEFYHNVDADGRHDVYNMVVLGFQNPLFAGAYIFFIASLALHLSHGLPSLFQSIGWNSPRFNDIFHRVGVTVALLLLIGYSSIPLACWLGYVRVH
ncbi:MAG: succinate dehydrogenase cytochrome b subunit [Leptospiraceae bacterium]|nr:succinate dehydrogenase cytochrome b subunit [Leptospiraceae bacterium]